MAKPKIDVEEIKRSLKASENQPSAVDGLIASTDRQFEIAQYHAQKLALRNKELENIISLRNSWSDVFKAVVIIVLAFEIIITVLMGVNWLVYRDEWFLRIIILGGIAQILAMPYLVTQFLFNTKSPLSKGEE